MGFSIRKSVRVGPVRFNVSKAGVGVSAGVRGLRFGTGPRGNYVRVGRRGVRYRSIGSSGSKPADEAPAPAGAAGAASAASPPPGSRPAPAPAGPEAPPAAHGAMREIESAAVSEMRDSSSADLLDELDRKRKRPQTAPGAAMMGGILIVALAVSRRACGRWSWRS